MYIFTKIINYFSRTNMYKNAGEYHDFCIKLKESEYAKELKLLYKYIMKQDLNLENPKLFSEKVQWLKLYDNIPIKSVLANKLQAINWLEQKIPHRLEYPKIYSISDSFDSIDFKTIPCTSFIIKTNHGFGTNYLVHNINEIISDEKKFQLLSKLFKKWMNFNFAFISGFELQYKDIEPKVFVQERLKQQNNDSIYDYGFMCFNGKVVYISKTVLDNNEEKVIIHDKNWQKLHFSYVIPQYDKTIDKPNRLEEMIEIAELISADFKLVRVDLYEINNRIYFSELTFTPSSGFFFFQPPEYDEMLGSKLNIH